MGLCCDKFKCVLLRTLELVFRKNTGLSDLGLQNLDTAISKIQCITPVGILKRWGKREAQTVEAGIIKFREEKKDSTVV